MSVQVASKSGEKKNKDLDSFVDFSDRKTSLEEPEKSSKKLSIKEARPQDHKVIPRFLGKDKVPIAQLNSNPSNRVKTTKYNWFTFLPITLFLQFARSVNIYYMCNGLL